MKHSEALEHVRNMLATIEHLSAYVKANSDFANFAVDARQTIEELICRAENGERIFPNQFANLVFFVRKNYPEVAMIMVSKGQPLPEFSFDWYKGWSDEQEKEAV
jgi:hypothetical protein